MVLKINLNVSSVLFIIRIYKVIVKKYMNDRFKFPRQFYFSQLIKKVYNYCFNKINLNYHIHFFKNVLLYNIQRLM